MILTDGPPGIGCPVIASLGGATAVLIVTEPIVAGRHDMERVAVLAHFFKIPVDDPAKSGNLEPSGFCNIGGSSLTLIFSATIVSLNEAL